MWECRPSHWYQINQQLALLRPIAVQFALKRQEGTGGDSIQLQVKLFSNWCTYAMPVVAKVWRKYQNSWGTTCSDWVWIIRMIWSDNCNHRLTQSGADPVQLGAISHHMQIVFIISSTNPNVCPGLKTIRYCQFSMNSGVEILKSLTFLFLHVCRSYRF